MDTMSQEKRIALDRALDRNAQLAGSQVNWRLTRIASKSSAREAEDRIRAHEALDRAIDAVERRRQRQFKRQRAVTPSNRPSIVMDAAADLASKDARQFLSDLAIGVDANRKDARPWFATLRSHVEQLPLNATVSDMDPRILRGCIRELL
jgi:hypothetical protein